MSRFLKILICAALACSAWAQDAYVKGGSFSDTVAKSAAKYRVAAAKRAADLAGDFKISDAYATFAFQARLRRRICLEENRPVLRQKFRPAGMQSAL